MKWVFISILMFCTAIAKASTPLSHALLSGNTLVKPESVQKIIEKIIAKNLQNDYLTESKFGKLSIQIPPSVQHLKIPKNTMLQDILTTLGIKNQIEILIDPIQTSINFGRDSLKIKVQKIGINLFKIRAHWQVKELLAKSNSLKIVVPKGVFDRTFTISSNPVKISLRPETGPITANLSMIAELNNEGAKISLDHFETNLNDNLPRLQAELGALTIDKKPFELEIISNGHSIFTDEPTVRTQFQNFEPELMKNIQKQLGSIIEEKLSVLSEALQKQDPFKISFNSNEVLDQYSVHDAAIHNLFKDISSSFNFSYIQEIPKQNLFTTQVTSQVCIASDCLSDLWENSQISSNDTAAMINSNVGVIIYESWVQDIINSAPFQKRVSEFYKNTLKSPGVLLGTDGIKIHFNPTTNAITAVLNLKIDIKATAPQKNANGFVKVFDFAEKQLADIWENIAGSGQYVYLPVEISAKIKGIQHNSQGKKTLVLQTSIPFHSDGTIANTYGYQCNVQKMNAGIRKSLLASVKSSINASIPATINISLNDPIDIAGIKFSINQIMITANKGLLIGGDINE